MSENFKVGMKVAIDSFIATRGEIVELPNAQEASVLVEDGPLEGNVEMFPLKSLKAFK